MIRIGKIVKRDKNVVMNVSPEYEDLVKKLAKGKTYKLLRCLIISQTEHDWRRFPIFTMMNFVKVKESEEFLTDAWQNKKSNYDLEDFKNLFRNGNEWKLFLEYEPNTKNDIEYDEKRFGMLFKDGLSKTFYPCRKKEDIILRRLIAKYLSNMDQLDDLHFLILHYMAAQLLYCWEASCLLLGKMILEGWNVKKMKEWFCNVFLIYTE